jgi:ABC-2 type transport system permease protein
MAKRTRARLAGESAMFLLVLGAALVLVNVLGSIGANARIDTTEAKAFSLSQGSKKLANNLEDQMEIRAYFSEELPPPFNAMGTYVRDLLAEYRDASGGKISLKLISPKTDEEKQAAEKDGVQRTADQKLEADSFGVQEGYRGISFHYMGESKAIARVDSTSGLEYEITQLIKQMVGVKTKIGVLAAHEAATPTKGLSSLKEYMPSYEMTEVQATAAIDPALKALLIVHPTTAFTDEELRRIDEYVMQGGSLAIFGGGIKLVEPDPQQQQQGPTDPSATPVDTGLNKVLEKWGVTLDNRIVADAQCGRARMPTQIPGLQIPVPYPPVPIVSFDEEQRKHPALFRMNQIGFPYPVRIAQNDNLKGDKDVKTTVLIRSTKESWLMEGDTIDLKARDRWEVPGYNGPYTMGVAIEGKLPSAFGATAASESPEAEAAAAKGGPDRATKAARVLVIGTGYFMRDEFLPKPQNGNQAMAGSVVLALNAIDWLTQDNDLIEIRAKTIEDPMLEVPLAVKETESTIRDAVEQQDQAKAEAAFEKRKEAIKEWDQRKANYRWGNTLAIPGLFALFGIVRWRVRAARKANLTL